MGLTESRAWHIFEGLLRNFASGMKQVKSIAAAVWAALLLGGAWPAWAQPRAEEPAKPAGFALVELFTSEGCNSCPPAEASLKALHDDAVQAGKPVFVLEYHVDYWNRLGWVDPYSNALYTQRQTNYARALQKDGLYTPEVVVNGQWEGPAANRKVLDYLVERALHQHAHATLTAIAKKTEDRAHINLSLQVTGAKPGAVLQIAVAEKFRRQVVTAGENRGRTLDHAYVVRKLESHALAATEATATAQGQYQIAIPAEVNPAVLALVVFVQDPSTLHILAASEVEVPY
jgi:hypothetical protein